MVVVDATRADDRSSQSARPELVSHPGNVHVVGHHDFGKPPRVNERIAARRKDPEPGHAQRPAPACGDVLILRDSDEPGHGVVVDSDGAVAAPDLRVGQGQRRGGGSRVQGKNRRARVVVRLPEGRTIPQFSKGERHAGFTLGPGRFRGFKLQCGIPGSTTAAGKSPCRDSASLAHVLSPRLDATRLAPSCDGVPHHRLARPGPAGGENRSKRDRDSQPPAASLPGEGAPGAPGGRTPSRIMSHLAHGSG